MTMTRRTALKSLAALAIVPTVQLRPEIGREDILAQFCDDWSTRYDMGEPFQVGSLTYATDARRACRAELTAPHVIGERRRPPISKVFDDHFHASRWFDFRLPEPHEMTIRDACGDCPHCRNRRVQCPIPFDELRWNRFGELDARTALIDYDVDDHTVRDASCEHCHGREYRGGNLFRVAGMSDGVAMCPILCHPLRRIERLQVAVGNIAERDMLLFRGDGFEGIVMSRNVQ